MTTTINAKSTGIGGLDVTGDASGALGLQTGGTTAVTIDTSQNVGIGTTTMTGKFNVSAGRSFFAGNSEQYSIGVGYNQSRVSSGAQVYYIGATDSATPALVFSEAGGAEKMRIDSNGNVGIGTTSPANKLDINGVVNASTATTTADAYKFSGWSLIGGNGYDLKFGGYTNGQFRQILFYGNDGSGVSSERMRIDSSGNLLVNATQTTPTASNASVIYGGADGGIIYMWRASGTTDQIRFYVNATKVGNITTTTTATTYNSGSDYRLKDNIVPMTNALDKVLQLKPVTFTWKADNSDGQGFIAHELQDIIPSAVTGKKDAIDSEGNPEYQGVDPSKIVATLTAAIQEQQTIINDLKARIETLESK